MDDLNEVASDNDDDKDDNNDANSKDIEVVKIGTGEALVVLDKLVNLKCLLKEERNSFVAKSAEQLAKPYHWLFYVRIQFVW